LSTISSKKRETVKLVAVGLIFATYLSPLSYVTPSFECVWAPETVKETVQYLMENSSPNDEVMSGAVIWALESNTRPFLNITHPLSFRPGMSADEIKEVEEKMLVDPPRFIILDGYTEQTYLKHVSMIKYVMDNSYSIKKEVFGSKYVVRTYELTNFISR